MGRVYLGPETTARLPGRCPWSCASGELSSALVSLRSHRVSTRDTTFQLRTRAAGLLEARLVSTMRFRKTTELFSRVPSQRPLQIAVYTDEPESLRPVLSANPRVSARFLRPSTYASKVDADVVILDRFAPPALRPYRPSGLSRPQGRLRCACAQTSRSPS